MVEMNDVWLENTRRNHRNIIEKLESIRNNTSGNTEEPPPTGIAVKQEPVDIAPDTSASRPSAYPSRRTERERPDSYKKQQRVEESGLYSEPVQATFSIRAKLVCIITSILLLSLGLITVLMWFIVRSDIERTAESNNVTINDRASLLAETALETIESNVSVFLYNRSLLNGELPADRFFIENPDIAAVIMRSRGDDSLPEVSVSLINERFFLLHEIHSSLVSVYMSAHESELGDTRTVLLNAAPSFSGIPILVMGFPWQAPLPAEGGNEGEEIVAVTVFFSSEGLTESFGSGANSSIMLNETGSVLVHPDREVINTMGNLQNLPGTANGERRLKTRYEFDGQDYFVSIQRIALGNALVLTTIPADVVFEGITATTRRNIYLSITALFLGILFIWFFAKTISEPLMVLKGAAEQIESGRYHLDLYGNNKKKPVLRDETGILIESVISMSHVLENFEKFTNKYIAQLARYGRLALGGTDKDATFFFSDIRSFTAISEKMRPEEVVEFLNEYMERMVSCITITGGTIDKFIGDAIMAHWGAVQSSGSSEEDALNAVRSALMMRVALMSFNAGRGGEKKPVIKIGCGLNSGRVVAGQIGSEERLEYTVIGEAVSIADRTETLNKYFGTEILITENTWRQVRRYIIAEEMPSVTQKGKKVRMFAVINMYEGEALNRVFEDLKHVSKINTDISRLCLGNKGPQTLAELRTLLRIPAPDLSKVNVDEEEKKYRVNAPNAQT
ncbi:MAG: adenylate/guanylate cyclase domain-containing protein [Treponema sp.]|jgi:adenylate cyclase|nr:adenylate/guanylate cyclase domain-containing protein [Treponema sp.]